VIKVLVVDDSALVRKLLGRVFSAEPDFEVTFARDGLDALAQLQNVAPDVVTLDVQMPHMDGLECLDRIMVERPCSVVMVSSNSTASAEATLEALRLGAIDFVAKPEGPVSLHIEEFGPHLVECVRAAAAVKPRSALRLRERIQNKVSARPVSRQAFAKPPVRDRKIARAIGDGLVLVGSSTGGPPALEALLKPLPTNFPWPILVAQHMPASFTGALARRLDTLCGLTVIEVDEPMPLRSGYVYIGRGDGDLVVAQRAGRLVALPAESLDYPWHPSADRLVRSAMAHVAPSQLVGVLMTGMGDDGASAMTELHAQGGRTIAEAEETAVVWGMPGELVKAEGADWVVPLPMIANRLQKLTP
jgi:two-component system chemotaxis response regulator CheB